MIEVFERPLRTINGRLSFWVAASNPIIYGFQRKDQVITSVSSNAGRIRITVNGVDLTTEISAGDVLYLNSDGVYDQNVTVTGISFSTNTIIDCNNDLFISATSGGFINLFSRLFYFLEVQIFDEATNENLFNTDFRYIPDTKGIIRADFSIYLRELLSNLSTYTVVAENSRAEGFSQGFYIKYTEQWQGSSETQVDDVANPIWAVNAVRQIQQTLGQNLGEYVTFDLGQRAKFLTPFEVPKLWRDYPFSVSFIYSDAIAGGLRRSERLLDLNEQVIQENTTFLDTSSANRKAVNRMKLDNNYSDDVRFVLLSIILDNVQQRNSNTFEELKDIAFEPFLSAQGYACGTNGAITKTINNGLSWALQTSNTNDQLNSIKSIGDPAIAVGNAGRIHRTTDGTNWASVTVAGASEMTDLLWKFDMFSGAYTCDVNGNVYRSLNFGASWSSISTPIASRLNAIDGQTVGAGSFDFIIAVGNNGVIILSDGGLPFTQANSGTTEHLLDVYYADEDTVFACGANGTILKSTNHGLNWTDLSLPGPTFDIKDIKFVGPQNGFFLNSVNRIWQTSDGGENWNEMGFSLIFHNRLALNGLLELFGCGIIGRISQFESGPITEDLKIQVLDPCVNPVYLSWNNSLGGDSYFMFDFNQVKETIFEDSEKFEQWTLYAEQLTENEFLTLDELNTEAVESREFFDELATADRTLNKRGIQVYEVQQDGTRVGVIVRSRSQQRETRFPTSDIVIRIKRPQQFKALV